MEKQIIGKSNMEKKITGKSTIVKTTRKTLLKRRGKSEKYSNFFITINTNYRAKSDSDFEQFQEKFIIVLKELYDVQKMNKHLIEFLEPNKNDSWTSEFIKNVIIHTNIEEGKTLRGGF